jgi:hypothetical protein
MQKCQGTTISRLFKARLVCCKFCDSPLQLHPDYVVFLAGKFVTGLVEWYLPSRNMDLMQSCLQMLKNNSVKESWVYKFVFYLH